jgi:hypothetical protein
MSPSNKHLGSQNELRACVWLIDHGYEVFRNVSAHGDTDIVAIKEGKFYRFDVKTGQYLKDGRPALMHLTKEQLDLGVLPLFVFPDGKIMIDENPVARLPENTRRICEAPACGREYSPRKWFQKFCSARCRINGWQSETTEAAKNEAQASPLVR